MSRLQLTGLSSARSGATATVTTSGTSITWSVDPLFPTIASPDYVAVVLDPGTMNEEILHVTAHTAGATTSTVVRNAEPVQSGAGSVAHTAVAWTSGPLPADVQGSGGGGGDSFAAFHPGFADPSAVVGTWALNLFTDTGITALNAYPAFYNSSAAQNDALSFDMWMEAGTYTVTALFRESTNTGILTVNLDGASQGTIDTYAAAPAYGTGSVTSITVPAGKRTWQFKVATKNASSTGYILELFGIVIRCTAGVSESAAQGTDLLGYDTYNPGSLAIYTATSLVDVDATNLKVTFTAPASGKVFITLNGLCVSSSTSGQVAWCVRESGTTVSDVRQVNGNTQAVQVAADFLITGLTPGSIHTYTWAQEQLGIGTATTYAGGTAGAAVIEVRDAGIGTGGSTSGGGGGSTSLLASSTYAPPTRTSYTAPAAFAEVDTTHARLTFSVPASGTVKAKANLHLYFNGGANVQQGVIFAIMEGGTQVGTLQSTLYIQTSPTDFQFTAPVELGFSGLTPGSVHTWDLAWKYVAAAGPQIFASQADGPLNFDIYDAGVSESAAQGTDLLAVVAYDPGGGTTYTTASNVLADVDATNLVTTFTAPASGKVLVRLEATSNVTATGRSLIWGVREGGSTVSGLVQANGNIDGTRDVASFLITGLTPGSTHTYKWGFSVTSASASMYVGAGAGAAIMEVRDAGIGAGGAVGDAAWTVPTLQGNWRNYSPTSGTGWAGAQFRKTAAGMVAVEGLVQGNGTNATGTLFTLPAGYRPAADLILIGVGDSLGGGPTSYRFDVDSTGVVTTAASVGSTTSDFVSIATSFFAEQ